MAVGYNPRVVTDGLVLALDAANLKSYDSRIISGQQTYTSSGTYSWTCPSGVTSVSVVCIGGGGGGNGGGNGVGGAGGGGGGGLGYKNNISVTPGQSYTVVVGGGGAGDAWDGPPFSANPADNGGDSYFIDATTVKGGGGGRGYGNSYFTGGSGGTYVGDGGGNGNSGGTGSGSGSGTGYLPATGGGGGSTGTYTGNATTRGTSKYITSNCTSGCLAGSGTGQGLLGDGSSGSYGRGGGANMNTFSNGTSGFTGAVRIMWGPDRSYPSTGVADQSGSTAFDDISGQGNNGTIVNGVGYSGDNLGSLSFDGVDDYVVTGNSGITGNIPWSISIWVSVNVSENGAGRQGWIIWEGSLNQSSNQLISIGVNSGKVEVAHWANDAVFLNSPINFNNFQNITVTYNGSQELIYINSVNTDSKSTSLNVTDGAWYFASRAGGTEFLNCNIAQVSIYNKALTASEIQQNFNALRGRFGI